MPSDASWRETRALVHLERLVCPCRRKVRGNPFLRNLSSFAFSKKPEYNRCKVYTLDSQSFVLMPMWDVGVELREDVIKPTVEEAGPPRLKRWAR
jgi:hypothetical protein